MSGVIFLKDLDYLGEKIQETGVDVTPLFKTIPSFLKPLRIFHLNYRLPFKNVWYKKWEKKLNNFEMIILPAANFTVQVAKYIDGLNLKKNIRCIYWYWDPVRVRYAPDKISDNWEKWSFDKEDCKTFNLKYNTQFFFDSISLAKQDLKYDVFFIGQDKGRLDELLRLKNEFTELGLISHFHIVSDNKAFGNKKLYTEKISYPEVLNYISKSKTILELYQEKQTGLTLRSMESVFFKKKLITNNRNITQYDIYCKENIFILGIDDINNIKDFVVAPYKNLEDKVILQYKFKEWLQRLLDKTELQDES